MQARVRVLNTAEGDIIHDHTLTFLENAGIHIEDDVLRRSMALKGCTIEGNRVRIPRSLIQQSLGARTPQATAGKTYNGTGWDLPSVIDLANDKIRPFDVNDFVDTVRLCETLPQIDMVTLPSIRQDFSLRKALVIAEQYTAKPIWCSCLTRQDAHALLTAANKAKEKRPYTAILPLDTPLIFARAWTDCLSILAQGNIQIAPVVTVTAGNLDEAIIITHATLLAVQWLLFCLSNDGTIVYGCRLRGGCRSQPMMLPVFSQLAQKNGFSSLLRAGSQQTRALHQWESWECYVLHQLLNQIAGFTYCLWLGESERGKVFSLPDLMLDCDTLSYLQKYTQTYPSDQKASLLATIDEAGPGGHFLPSTQTVNTGDHLPAILSDQCLPNDDYAYAKERVNTILAATYSAGNDRS